MLYIWREIESEPWTLPQKVSSFLSITTILRRLEGLCQELGRRIRYSERQLAERTVIYVDYQQEPETFLTSKTPRHVRWPPSLLFNDFGYSFVIQVAGAWWPLSCIYCRGFKNRWSCTSTSLYSFMRCRSMTHKNNFITPSATNVAYVFVVPYVYLLCYVWICCAMCVLFLL